MFACDALLLFTGDMVCGGISVCWVFLSDHSDELMRQLLQVFVVGAFESSSVCVRTV